MIGASVAGAAVTGDCVMGDSVMGASSDVGVVLGVAVPPDSYHCPRQGPVHE